MGFLCCGDHALSDRVAVHDATKNIHKDRLDVWILEDDLESCSDLFFCCAATDIKEVCRVAAVMLDGIHCRHGQAGTVDETGDVAVETDVIEIVFRRFDFARILRAMLRQAPNVILVGEIRDRETAEIAVQAALTGHLVFSTLHTNDAPSAVTRLVHMGVKPFLVSAALQAVMAQRLVRVLCPACKSDYAASDVEIRTLGLDPAAHGGTRLYRAVGCDDCEHTGYRGRLGIFELLVLDGSMREMIFRGESTLRLREHARNSAGMRTLNEDGVSKVLEGTTSIDELLRVTASR